MSIYVIALQYNIWFQVREGTSELVLSICDGTLIVEKDVKESRDCNSGRADAEESMVGKTPALSQQCPIFVVSMPSGISEPHGLKSIDVGMGYCLKFPEHQVLEIMGYQSYELL